jgi:hypothetical protein
MGFKEVFPLKSWREGGKAPAIEGGLTVATLAPDLIDEWWSTRPECNVGIATGAASGFWLRRPGSASRLDLCSTGSNSILSTAS